MAIDNESFNEVMERLWAGKVKGRDDPNIFKAMLARGDTGKGEIVHINEKVSPAKQG